MHPEIITKYQCRYLIRLVFRPLEGHWWIIVYNNMVEESNENLMTTFAKS